MKDIQFEDNDSVFNCRVNGVMIKEGRVLLSKLRNDANWTTVGGKVTFGETSEDAILREFREEMGSLVSVDRLLGVVEHFFDFKGKTFHQYLFVYKLKDTQNKISVFEGDRQMADKPNGICCWFPIDELDTISIKPDCLRRFLKDSDPGILHICESEPKKTI